MTRMQTRAASLVLAAVFSVFAGQGRAEAAQAAKTSPDQQAAQVPTTIVVADQDASATRQRLMEVLRRQPASLGRVLKLDPSLLTNQAYLAPYPALAMVLAQHPEIAHNPSYFLQNIETSEGSTYRQDSEGVSLFREMFGDFIAFAVFLTVVGVVIWFVRQIIDHRRWNRLAKVQADAHGKLFDKLSSNEELLAYVQSSAGSRFLESAPIQVEVGAQRISAPVGRILISVQIGIVLASGGAGLYWVSRYLDLTTSAGLPMFGMSVLGMAIGAGFVISAAVSYALSRQLGLFDPVVPPSPERGAASTRQL